MVVCVIGGGASGMMAALTASEHPANEVILIERQARLGRKLLATGNGRCNLSNSNTALSHYHGQQAAFCKKALEAFDVEQTLAYFRSLGLLTVQEESGRIYPASDSANSVADVLRLHLEQRKNVRLLTGCEVSNIKKCGNSFSVFTDADNLICDRVILCAGGVAGGKLGGTDAGYRLLGNLGHSRTKLYPALVQIKTDPTLVRSLKGVRCEALVRFEDEERRGELQFTDYGLSGPVIFEISRYISTSGGKGMVQIGLLPHTGEGKLKLLLAQRVKDLPELPAEHLLVGLLHNRLGRTVLRACGFAFEQSCGSFKPGDLKRIAQKIKCLQLEVQGVMGMDAAQVTAGGILTSEFDPETMESLLCPGLYAAGEVLDIDGDCGGYNLQWAWSSGRLAGQLKGKL